MRQTIGVVIPAHRARLFNGMLTRAITSVHKQQLQCDDLVIRHDNHKAGSRTTRALGIQQSMSDWTALLDSDDEFMPHHLSSLYAFARETGADYVYPWYKVIGGDDPRPHLFAMPFDRENPAHHPSVIFARTDLLQSAVSLLKPKRAGQGSMTSDDYALMTACLSLGADIYHYPHRTWFWHHHGGNTSGWQHQGDAS